MKQKKIGILTVEETTNLLKAAPESARAALAIGAFAGLRSAELGRLDWAEVRLTSGFVEVSTGKSKTASRRFVQIQPNLAAWLSPLAKREGKVCPKNWRKHFDAARKAADLIGKAWPHNALRHGFASYYAAEFRDAGALAAEMGHTTPSITFQHYLVLCP